MRTNLRANVELGAQIIIAVAVVVVAGVFVKRQLFPRYAENLPRINAGERLNIPEVNWRNSERTLVLFLNKTCHYCKSSAPFYRELVEAASRRNVKSVAVLPNSIEEAKAYLSSVELSVDDVRTGPFSSYKIPGTPTVLIVNSEGMVERVWFGATAGREKEMRDEFLALLERSPTTESSAKQ